MATLQSPKGYCTTLPTFTLYLYIKLTFQTSPSKVYQQVQHNVIFSVCVVILRTYVRCSLQMSLRGCRLNQFTIVPSTYMCTILKEIQALR